MGPVRHALVDVLAILGRRVGGEDEEQVAEEEEGHDGERGADGGVPAPFGAVDVEVDEADGDEGVDDGEGVGDEAGFFVSTCKISIRNSDNLLDDEIVSITSGRGDDGNDCDEPVLHQTRQRGIEGAVAGPEARKGEDALTTELLDEATLGEDDTKDVSEGRESDEDTEGTFGRLAKHVAEEGGSNKALAGQNLFLGDPNEVRDVGEDVQDSDTQDGERGRDLEGADGVLHLAQGVVGVAVADIAPDDVVEGGDDSVGASSGALKGLVSRQGVGCLVQADERSDDNDEEDDDLDGSEEVLEADSPFQDRAVDQEGGGDDSQTDASLVPGSGLNAGSEKDIFSKDNTITGAPTQEDTVTSVETGGEKLGLAEDVFEDVLFTTITRDTCMMIC